MNYTQNDKNSIKYMFNLVAQNYDKLNDFMSFGLQRSIKFSAVKNVIGKFKDKETLKILDLCTGSGDIAILFEKMLPDCEITAVDFSENMLNIAKTRSENIKFIKGDVCDLKELNLKKENFDICFIGFGLRNLPDIDDFIVNIKDYIKPSGVLSILDLGKAPLLIRPLLFIHYEILIPLLGLVFNGDSKPYKYLINSAKNYPVKSVIIKKLKNAGFRDIKNYNFAFGSITQQIAEK